MTEQELATAQHEAGHAASALCLGIPVIRASRRSADPRASGFISIPVDDLLESIDREKARAVTIMLLCGPAMAEQPLPTWPLSDATNDEKLLRIFAEYLKLDERGYHKVVAEMWRLSATKRFDRLHRTLMAWFQHRVTLDKYVLAPRDGDSHDLAWEARC